MKKLFGLLFVSGALIIASCGGGQDEAAAEQARLDSIAKAEAAAAEQARLDSIAQAEAAAVEQARLDSIAKADSIAKLATTKAKPVAKAKKATAPAKTEPAKTEPAPAPAEPAAKKKDR